MEIYFTFRENSHYSQENLGKRINIRKKKKVPALTERIEYESINCLKSEIMWNMLDANLTWNKYFSYFATIWTFFIGNGVFNFETSRMYLLS